MIYLRIFLFVLFGLMFIWLEKEETLKECFSVLLKLDQFTTFTVLQILSFLKTLTDKNHLDQFYLNIFIKISFFIIWSKWLARKEKFSQFYR